MKGKQMKEFGIYLTMECIIPGNRTRYALCSIVRHGIKVLTSLNNELLQGPDLTNSLVDVLLRFREEKVAVMADIESMFMMVKVPQKDRNLFQFLWWPNGDMNMNADSEEYRMTRHIFGATSSPS